MSSTEMEKYSQGYVFSQQAELDQLQDPENYMEEVTTARRLQQESIAYNQRIAAEPLSSNSREAWARRNQAKKAVKEAKKATKQINKLEKEVKEQVTARRTYLEAQKTEEKKVYVEAAKKKEQEMKFLVEKEKWVSSHKIRDIPKGIELGYLSEGSMSWYNRLKALEAPYANRRSDLPSHERHKLEFLYKGGTEKEWGDIRERERVNRQLSQKQSASIKEAAAIVESGGTLDSQRGSPLAPGSLMGSDLRATSTDPKIAAANQAQSAYVAQLRAGGIGLAQALLKPQTDQSYIVKGEQATKDQTTINLEKFLTERGYDISKPETIPDSIFKAPVKYTAARAQTKEPVMGDLRDKTPTSPQITEAELKQRAEIQKKFAIPSSPVYAQGSRTILTQEDGKGKISVLPIGEPRLISGDESKQAPHLTITKTETITTPDKYGPASQVLVAKEDSKLPPGFESGEATPLINYDKGLAGGFFGYLGETYTSFRNLLTGEEKYATPSLESSFVDETISSFGSTAKGEMPDLMKSGQTWRLANQKGLDWAIGSAAASVTIGLASFGAQKGVSVIKGLATAWKWDKQIANLATQFSSKTQTYQVEKLPSGKYLLTAGTEANPAQVPAIIVQPGRKGSSQLYSEYLPSQIPPTDLTIKGGTKGLGFEKMQEIAPYLKYVPGTKSNIQMMSSPGITDFVKPVGQTTKFSWEETKKFPKTVLSAASSSDAQMSRGIIAETKAVRTKPVETKPFKTTVLSPSGKNVDRIFSPKTGKFRFPGSKKIAPEPSGKPSLVEPTKTTQPNTEKVKEIVKEMTEAEKKAFANMEIKTGTTSAVLGSSTLGTAKVEGVTEKPQTTTTATVFSAPQTVTFTGPQTTTATTIPLSRNLIMGTPTIQKDKASIPLKDIAVEITGAREKQSMKSATIPLSKTAVKSSLTQPQTTKTNLRLVPGQKWQLKTQTKLALVPAQKMTTYTPTPTPTRERAIIPDIPLPNTLKTEVKETKKKRKKKQDFLGNVSERSILGVYKRKELTYGRKKVLKLSSKDARLQKKAKSSLELLKESDLKTKRKKRSKTQTILGFKQPKDRKLTKSERKRKAVVF